MSLRRGRRRILRLKRQKGCFNRAFFRWKLCHKVAQVAAVSKYGFHLPAKTYIVYSGSSDSISFDTVVGGLFRISIFSIGPKLFWFVHGYSQSVFCGRHLASTCGYGWWCTHHVSTHFYSTANVDLRYKVMMMMTKCKPSTSPPAVLLSDHVLDRWIFIVPIHW